MINLAQTVLNGVSRSRDRIVIVNDKQSLTGKNFASLVHKVMETLNAHGLSAGDRVLLINDGDIAFPVFYLAIIGLGGVVVPCPSDDRNRFGRNYLTKRAAPSYVISACGSEYQKADKSETIIVVADRLFSLCRPTSSPPEAAEPCSKLLANLGAASLMFTSGTTGEPKGVVVTHQNLQSTLEKNIKFQRLDESTVELNTLPVTHSFGLGQLNATLAVGGKTILLPSLANLGRVFKAAKNEAVTSFPTTPAGLSLMTGRYISVFHDSFTSLKSFMVNSAPLPPSLAQTVLDTLPQARLLVYYGLTEASRSTFADLSTVQRNDLASVGTGHGNTKIEIAEETGEILISGDNVSPGYFVDALSPLRSHPDGKLRTGDRGELDENGSLTVLGRLSDEINIGGYKVDPLEVERIALYQDGVAQACLSSVETQIGISETVLLFQANGPVDSGELRAQMSKELEAYKVPKHIMQVPNLPTGLNGKLDRKAIANLARQDIT